MKVEQLKPLHEPTMGEKDYVLCFLLIDGGARFAGRGLKWRVNPLHPRGWKKLSTAEDNAKNAKTYLEPLWLDKVSDILVCERAMTFRCLSSYAISKQNHQGDSSDA